LGGGSVQRQGLYLHRTTQHRKTQTHIDALNSYMFMITYRSNWILVIHEILKATLVSGRDRSVSIMNRLRAGPPAGTREGCFPLRHRVQSNSWAHQPSYEMGTSDLSPGVKRPSREANHSSPSTVEVKNAWSYNSTPQHVFMALCLIPQWMRHGTSLSTVTTLPSYFTFYLYEHWVDMRGRCRQ